MVGVPHTLRAALLAISGAFGPSVIAQPHGYEWEAIVLHTGGTRSIAYAVHEGVVGTAGCGPALWDRRTGELVECLLPSGWTHGLGEGGRWELQGGQASNDSASHAIVWKGSRNNYTDFDLRVYSDEYWTSGVHDLSDTDAVGYSGHLSQSDTHAIQWLDLDDPSQFVDLHPVHALRSWAYATDGTLQGGRVTVRIDGIWRMHAALWSGSAESFVDMNPPDSQESIIEDMAPGVQVGWAVITTDGFTRHASLWRGTPESWEDLSPTGAHNAYLFGTTGTHHVGRASIGGGFTRAGIWMSDDPDSYHNLEQYLPPEYDGSSAYGVHEEGKKIYVVGSATYSSRPHAILWMGTRLGATGQGGERDVKSIERRP